MSSMEEAYKATIKPINAQDLDDDTTRDIYYERIEMPFNSLMTEFFDASDINDLIERMLAKTENPKA